MFTYLSLTISTRGQLLSALRFAFLYYQIISEVIAMTRGEPGKSYGRDRQRVWFPSDAAKDSKDSCRYWHHNSNLSVGPLSKVPFMNQDLNSDDLFRGLNPKIQMVQAVSLSAERNVDRELILIFDIFFAGEYLVLIVSRYHRLNPRKDFSVQIMGKNNYTSDLQIGAVTTPRDAFPRDPNQVHIIIFRSKPLSILLRTRRSALLLSPPPPDDESYIECVVRAAKTTKTFKISINHIYTPANDGRTLNMVTVTMIGYATQITEMRTWLQYYLRIGFDHVFFYAMFPISCLTGKEVDALNSLAVATNFSFTLIQWHPYFVDVSYPKVSNGHNQLSVSQDLLYRLKGVPNNGVDIWVSSMDVDEFMVVHPRYRSAPAMVTNLMKTCGSLSFASSFFSLIPRSAAMQQHHHQQVPSNLSDWEHLAMASNFTLSELEGGIIVHEANLQEHYRPKNLFFTRGVVYMGGHEVAEFIPGFHPCWSGSYFLHYGENGRGRGISTMKKPEITSLQELLQLPRNESNPIFTQKLKWRLWSPQEDKQLVALIKINGYNW